MFEVEFTVDQDDDDKGRVYWSDIDYGFVFHPVEMIALGWHAGLETEGCVLPIYDDNLESGKFGSDGFTLQVTPVDGLRLAVSVPFDEGEYSHDNYAFIDCFHFHEVIDFEFANSSSDSESSDSSSSF